MLQRVSQHVAAHAFAGLVVKVLKERREVFELQHCQDVVVSVHRDLQQPGELLRHGAAGRYAAGGREDNGTLSNSQFEGAVCICRGDVSASTNDHNVTNCA